VLVSFSPKRKKITPFFSFFIDRRYERGRKEEEKEPSHKCREIHELPSSFRPGEPAAQFAVATMPRLVAQRMHRIGIVPTFDTLPSWLPK